MAKFGGRVIEHFLLSDGIIAKATLPVAATVFLILAVVGSGIPFGPTRAVSTLLDRHTKPVPTALVSSDGVDYEDWVGPPGQMSDFIRNQIIENLQMASNDDSFEGKAFSDALRLTGLAESKSDDEPTTEASNSQGNSPSTQKVGEGEAASPTPLAASTAAVDRWTDRYWCTRQGWELEWRNEIVRPLVARGVGGCTGLERFYARSPLISTVGVFFGVLFLVILCIFAVASAFLFSVQLAMREAYRMQYASAVLRR